MIIELLLRHDEAIAHIDHGRACRDRHCDDIAHLHDKLTRQYAGLAEVFTFIAGMDRGHQYRLNHARARAGREALPTRSLDAIRQAWDEAEQSHANPLT